MNRESAGGERAGNRARSIDALRIKDVPIHMQRMLPQLSSEAVVLLLGGGVAYTLGAVVYARHWPDPWPGRFGHHEVWHLFVLAGAGAHYAFTYSLLHLACPPL